MLRSGFLGGEVNVESQTRRTVGGRGKILATMGPTALFHQPHTTTALTPSVLDCPQAFGWDGSGSE